MTAEASPAAGRARGILYLVVGPSGAGKDSVIDGARAAFEDDRRLVFCRRLITRPREAGGEDHEAVGEADFEVMRAAGRFSLCWRAHGLGYALPLAIEGDLADGRSVVANVSRTVIDDARRRLGPVRVIHVTAPPAVLARRLAARGRESAADIEERLRRGGLTAPRGADVEVIVNDGPLERAVERFVALLRRDLDPTADRKRAQGP